MLNKGEDYKIKLYKTLKKRIKFLHATHKQNTNEYNQKQLEIITKKTKVIIDQSLGMKKRINDVGRQINDLKRNRMYKCEREKINKLIRESSHEGCKLSLKEVASKFRKKIKRFKTINK